MKKIGRYDIIAELGRGAMGIVYRASDPTIGREVALKVLSLNASTEEGTNSPQQMFMREVRAAGRLAHPSIVTIHDAFDDKEDQTSCIVMELVPGVTLEKILESGHPLGMERILSIIRQVAEGLDYAHRNQVIHRDLKPANILVTEDGRAKITDFGIAKVLAREGLARTVGIMGTPSFMSPEQVKGGDIDARTDIFSLGIIIFTMMAGRKPFLGNSAAVMFKIVYEEPPPPSTLNAQLTPAHDYLTKKCLAKDRNLRYSSAREFLDDLDDLQHSRPLRSQAGAPALVSPAPAFTSRRDQPPAVEAPIAIAPPPPPPMPPINSAAPTAFGEFPTLRTEPPPHSFEPAPRPVTPLPPPVAGPPKPVTTPPVPPAPAHGPLTPPSPGGTMVMNTPGFLAEEAPPPSPPVATRPPAPAPVQPPKPVAPPPIAPPPRAAAPVPPRPPLTPPDPRGTMVMQSPALISRVPQPPPPRVGATPPGGPPAAAQPPKPFAPPSAAPVPARPPLTPPDPSGTMVMQNRGVVAGPSAPPPRVVAGPPVPVQPPKPVASPPGTPPAKWQPPTGRPPSAPPPGPIAAPPAVPPGPSKAPAASSPAAFGATMIGRAIPTPPPPHATPAPPAQPPAQGIPAGPPPAAGPRTGTPAAPLHPAAASAVPPPEPGAQPAPAPKSNLIPILVGGVVVVLLAAAGLVFWGIHRARMASPPPPPVAVQTPQLPPPPPTVATSTEAPPPPVAPVVEEPKPPENAVPGTVRKPIVHKPKPAAAPAPVLTEPTSPPVQPQPVAPAPNPTPPPPTPEEIAKAEAARLAKVPRIVQVACNYGMKEATFVFSAGGKTLFEETLKGNKVKQGYLGIKGSYQGNFSHTITVPAGISNVTVHVLARDGATDLTKDIKMPPVGGFIPTLAVDVDSEHLSINWKGSSTATK